MRHYSKVPSLCDLLVRTFWSNCPLCPTRDVRNAVGSVTEGKQGIHQQLLKINVSANLQMVTLFVHFGQDIYKNLILYY